MTDDEIQELYNASFDRDFLEEVIRTRAQCHPDDIPAMLRFASMGLVNLLWRNTVVEDAHAGPDSRISDSEMMRANSRLTAMMLTNFMTSWGDPMTDGEIGCRDDLERDPHGMLAALDECALDLIDPELTLPNGMTALDLVGEDHQELVDHIELQIGGLCRHVEEDGPVTVLMWLASRGMTLQWWGSTRWRYIVDVIMKALDDPTDSHWRTGYPTAPVPEAVADRVRLRRDLLSAPWELPADAAAYMIYNAHLGFVRTKRTTPPAPDAPDLF